MGFFDAKVSRFSLFLFHTTFSASSWKLEAHQLKQKVEKRKVHFCYFFVLRPTTFIFLLTWLQNLRWRLFGWHSWGNNAIKRTSLFLSENYFRSSITDASWLEVIYKSSWAKKRTSDKVKILIKKSSHSYEKYYFSIIPTEYT